MTSGLTHRLAQLWWVQLPQFFTRFSKTLAAIVSDGFYWIAWPLVAAAAPPLAIATGFLIGWQHFSAGNTFTFSLGVMAILLAIANFGAGLGSGLWLGYVLGDWLLFSHPTVGSGMETLLRVRVPLALSYILLAQLAIFIPLASQALRQGALPRLQIAGHVRGLVAPAVEAVLQGSLQGGLVFVWVQAVPTLIRPVYTWRGIQPPIAAIAPLQEQGSLLVYLAIFLGAARVFLEYWALSQPGMSEQVAQFRQILSGARPHHRSLPAPVRSILGVAFTTFLLSGLFAMWSEALLFFLALLLMFWVRDRLRPRLQPWFRLINPVPLFLRVLVATAINYGLSLRIVSLLWRSTSTFLPVLISVFVGVAVFFLLVPPAERPEPATSEGGAQ